MSIPNAQSDPRISSFKKAGYEDTRFLLLQKLEKRADTTKIIGTLRTILASGPGHMKLTKIEESGVRIFRTKKLKQPASYIKNPTHTFMKEVADSEYLPNFDECLASTGRRRLVDLRRENWSFFEDIQVNGKNFLKRVWWSRDDARQPN